MKNIKKRKIMICIIFLAVCIVLLISFYNKLIAKRDYVAESNHNTQADDRKLVKYSNFNKLEYLTGNKYKKAQLLNDIDELIVNDFHYIKERLKQEEDIDEFWENNKKIFEKDIAIIEKSSLNSLYNKLNNISDINDLKEYETCEFYDDSENSISFKIQYSKKISITGIIVLAEDGNIYIEF